MLKYTITQKNKARGDPTWYGRTFDTRTKEVRFLSLGTSLKRQAEEWLRKKITEEMTGVKERQAVTIYRATSDYLKTYENRTGAENHRYLFNHLNVFAADSSLDLLEDITPEVAIEFFASLQQLKAVTRKRMLTMLKTWWRWCRRAYGIKSEIPFEIVKVEKPDPPDRSFWTTEQLAQILNASSLIDRPLYALMAYAGLRIHEAVKVRWEDIHDGKIHIVGKGKSFAAVPISERMQRELDLAEHRWSTIVKQMQVQSYSKRLHRLFQDHPELDFGGKVHPHRFRHSFASNLAIAGVGEFQLMRLMRHTSITMTQRYTHLRPDDLSEAINKV